MNQLEIKQVEYTQEIKAIQSIRKTVFQIEQKVSLELEFDGQDETAKHLLAYLNNQPVGTLRIRKLDQQTAKIERLAVLKPVRGQGIGTKLTKVALEIMKQQNHQQVIIHAQEYIQELYQKLGFEPIGNTFEEAGITHIKMIKKLEEISDSQ